VCGGGWKGVKIPTKEYLKIGKKLMVFPSIVLSFLLKPGPTCRIYFLWSTHRRDRAAVYPVLAIKSYTSCPRRSECCLKDTYPVLVELYPVLAGINSVVKIYVLF
jgi:hypothetical protein